MSFRAIAIMALFESLKLFNFIYLNRIQGSLVIKIQLLFYRRRPLPPVPTPRNPALTFIFPCWVLHASIHCISLLAERFGDAETNRCTWSREIWPFKIWISLAKQISLTNSRTWTATSSVSIGLSILRDPDKMHLDVIPGMRCDSTKLLAANHTKVIARRRGILLITAGLMLT